MFELKNKFLKAAFDEQGRIIVLENLREGTGNIIEKPAEHAFLLNCKKGENWENPAFGHKQRFRSEQKENSITYYCDSLFTRDGEIPISLKLIIRLEDEDLLFDAQIINTGYDLLVTDFEYPKIGIIKQIGGKEPALFAPIQAGIRIDKIGTWLSERSHSRENNPYSFEINYPGSNGSMHWMALQGGGQTLYASCHDPDFYSSQMRIDGSIEDSGAMKMVFEIMPFIKPGETWNAPSTLLKLYKGDWHHGADEYRRWAAAWRPVRDKPQWIKDLLGMFLVINKQQYGDEMWPYDTLPQLWDLAQDHGFENLSLFGWYDSGHDNQYPDLKASDSLGGTETLKQNIKKVQDKGGKVTLYQQGHLIDTTTDFYRNGGYLYESRTRSNTPYFEYYNKSHRSMFLKNYTSKYFAISCPSCPEWRDLMVSKTNFVESFGADAVLFDQIGGMWAYPCFNEKHPHDKGKPSLSMSGGRQKLLESIRNRTRELRSNYAFFSEHVTDLYSAWLDCLHACLNVPSEEGDYLTEGKGLVKEPSLFRYCFPETKITLRNPFPYMSKRMTNFAFIFGMVFEMEIRYQQDKEDVLAGKWLEEQQYAKAVNDFRKKYMNELVRANFVDQKHLEKWNQRIITKVYETKDTISVALWNDSSTPEHLSLIVTGAQFVEYATLDNVMNTLPSAIPPRSIALVIFRKI